MKKWFIFIAILILLIFLVPFFYWKEGSKAEISKDELPRVRVIQLKPDTQASKLTLPSSAQAWHFTPIWSRVNGYLLRYHFDIGDRVKSGDLLAEIDTPETDQQLEQARADLLNAISQRDIAKLTSERWSQLWEKNPQAVSKQEVDQYLANWKSADANVLMNEKNVARLNYETQFKNIFAPFDGIVTQRFIDTGSLIYGNVNETAQELFQVAQINTIRFFVQVPQTYYREIHLGLDAEVRIHELQGKIFKGKVMRYAKSLDPIARTLQTEVDVENPEYLIYPGLYGTVTFSLKPVGTRFIIPTSAIILRKVGPQVAVIDDKGIAHLQTIQIGRDFGAKMEIIGGLQENDSVVINPTDQIRDGVKVNIISIVPYQLLSTNDICCSP